jgi:hypothetical protein
MLKKGVVRIQIKEVVLSMFRTCRQLHSDDLYSMKVQID